jgi:hypothetical protein
MQAGGARGGTTPAIDHSSQQGGSAEAITVREPASLLSCCRMDEPKCVQGLEQYANSAANRCFRDVRLHAFATTDNLSQIGMFRDE